MEKQLQIMPEALRLLAGEIKAPDYIPEMCLRDAAAMIESLVEQRDDARKIAAYWRNGAFEAQREAEKAPLPWENDG